MVKSSSVPFGRHFGLADGMDLVASPRCASDIYVVEYPKSGITWLTTMIAHMALSSSGRDDIDVTFANLRLIIPDIHLGREIGPPVYTSPPFRFIKSHSSFNPHYAFSIYLVRNPVGVAGSHYRYLVSRKHIDMPFRDFLRDRTFGIHHWRNHVMSWLEPAKPGGIMHLVRYEDLAAEPEAELAALCENIGWRVSGETISAAVDRAQSALMQASEARFVARDPRFSAGFVKGERFPIEHEDRAYILETCGDGMARLGYEVAA